MVSTKKTRSLLLIVCYIQACQSLVIPDDDGKILNYNYEENLIFVQKSSHLILCLKLTRFSFGNLSWRLHFKVQESFRV
jgi:hypothetical protein